MDFTGGMRVIVWVAGLVIPAARLAQKIVPEADQTAAKCFAEASAHSGSKGRELDGRWLGRGGYWSSLLRNFLGKSKEDIWDVNGGEVNVSGWIDR